MPVVHTSPTRKRLLRSTRGSYSTLGSSVLAHLAAAVRVYSLPMAQAIVFDFDGVIVHSEPTHLMAVREVLSPLEVPLLRDTYFERYVHLPDRELLRKVTDDAGHVLDEDSLGRLLSAKHDAFERLLAAGDSVQVYPGVVELIRSCAAHVPVGLCTAAQSRTVTAVLRGLDVLPLFRAITTADDVARSKPDPMPYLRTARQLGHDPADCVAIEDTVGGLTSAKAAGCKAVAVGHTQPKVRLTAIADRYVDRIAELTAESLLAL